MKRKIALLIAGILCLSLAACSKAPVPEQVPQETNTETTNTESSEQMQQQRDNSGSTTEKPEDIIAEIIGGMHSDHFKVIVSREEAIRAACKAMQAGDVLIVAGKGHENYQIIGKTKQHFDDHEIILREMC